MKHIQTMVLFLMVLTLVSCSSDELAKKDQEITDLRNKVDSLIAINHIGYEPNTLKALKDSAKKFDRKSGEFIRVQEAHDQLEMLKDHVGRNPRNPDRPREGTLYAFSFGLEKVEILMKEIERRNKIKKDSIIGLRVYYGRKNRSGNQGPDAFVIPVAWNMKNLYKIDDGFDKENPFQDPSYILNSSVPCPDECD